MRFCQAAVVLSCAARALSMALRCFVLSTAHSLDVLLQHARHLEHAQRVGRQDLLLLLVRRDGAALVELVLLDVPPERLRHPQAGHLGLAADRSEVGGQRLGGEEPDALLLHRRRALLAGRDRRLALVDALRPLAARVLHDLLLLLFLLLLLLLLLLLGLLLLLFLLLLGLLLLRLLLLRLLRLLRRLLLRPREGRLGDLLLHLAGLHNDDRKLRLHAWVAQLGNLWRCRLRFPS